MMTYKGYGAAIRFDDEADIFHGEVTGLRDVVTFQGRTVDELKSRFRNPLTIISNIVRAVTRLLTSLFPGVFSLGWSPHSIANWSN